MFCLCFRKSVEAGLNEILDLNQKKIQKTVEAELNEILDMNQKQIQQLEAAKNLNRLKDKTPTIISDKDDNSDVYCTVDDLRRKLHSATPFEVQKHNNENSKLTANNVPRYRNKVAATVAHWEKRVMEERTSQIFNRLQKKQLEAAKEAEDAEKRQEILWREQGKNLILLLGKPICRLRIREDDDFAVIRLIKRKMIIISLSSDDALINFFNTK